MRWAKQQGIMYYDMVHGGRPQPGQPRREPPPLRGHKFKVGFGGEVADFVGCLDLPVKRVRAKLWNRFEPAYYRLHQRLKGDI